MSSPIAFHHLRISHRRGENSGNLLGLLLLFCLFAAHSLRAQDSSNTNAQTQEGAKSSETALPSDASANRFVRTCAGCHTVGRGKLTGPDLVTSTTWPPNDLKQAIKRMEKHVGPLSEADLQQLADFLKDPDIQERIKAEESRVAQMFAAKMDPPSAALGRELFAGKHPLKNGGLACAACHEFGGFGGNLGPSLSGVHAKMGGISLVSAIEKSNFKIMDAVYREQPITKQEALHLAKFLETPAPVQAIDPSALWTWGGLGSAVILLGIMSFYRSNQTRRDTRLKKRRK